MVLVLMGFCDLLGFLFVSYCARQRNIERKPYEKFDIDFQWSYINFTWPSPMDYHYAVTNSKYIPENNAMAGIKYYDNRMYIALPRLKTGTPVTLAFIPMNSKAKTNPLLRPFPSWDMNVKKNCSTFQNVQSMEIDRYGVMWVLDGVRTNTLTKCPPKIVLLDLKNGGRVLHTYVVPNDVTLHQGGFLNDIVVDESDGGFAYITDNSMQDPGLIIYSRVYNKSWKLRDASMYGEVEASDFVVDGVMSDSLAPIDGIALGPTPLQRKDSRMVYYSALTSYNLYAISTHILKDEEVYKTGEWRREIEYVGQKRSQSDGLVIDNKGNLYYGLLSRYGVGKWNIKKPFGTAKNVEINKLQDADKSSSELSVCPPYLTNTSSSCSLCINRGIVYEVWTDSDISPKSTKQSHSSSNCTQFSTRLRSRKLKDKVDNSIENRSYCYWIDRDDFESSTCSSAYGHSMPKLPIKKSSKILDMLSKWFWKCSPGCQQIPPIN
ncbi:hypothetical protein RN001_009177 [Aquatica leii]|uniref:Uncharacterized protein n=1 Tax=Aquatica leii TaxID=1421715 RepID=A0AAN7P7B4_9COLE|nr:hypothetical protein RN001_009177 [Aquatica leii]